MVKVLKAFFIFAAMIALPIVADNIISRRPSVPLNAPDAIWFVAIILLLGGVGIMIGSNQLYVIHDRLEEIAGWLQLAERDFNSNINSASEHGGRKGKAAERAEWAKMADTLAAQTFNAGFRTVAHDAFDANEKDLSGKGKAMGKASMTAFLLRELYEGNVSGAKMKVYSDIKNGDTPYIAPGIRELIGYAKFDPALEGGFPKDAGVRGWEMGLAVKIWGYPRNLLIVKTAEDGTKTVTDNWDVIASMTGYKRPEPLKPKELQWKLWHIAMKLIHRAIWGR